MPDNAQTGRIVREGKVEDVSGSLLLMPDFNLQELTMGNKLLEIFAAVIQSSPLVLLCCMCHVPEAIASKLPYSCCACKPVTAAVIRQHMFGKVARLSSPSLSSTQCVALSCGQLCLPAVPFRCLLLGLLQRFNQAEENLENQRGPPQDRCLFGSDLDFEDAELVTNAYNTGRLMPLHPGKEIAMIYGNDG